jgi:hypothetical protein
MDMDTAIFLGFVAAGVARIVKAGGEDRVAIGLAAVAIWMAVWMAVVIVTRGGKR